MTWTCPKCGKPNLMEHYFCTRCGASRNGCRNLMKLGARAKTWRVMLDQER